VIASYGVVIGVLLLVAVTAVAILLGAKAEGNVRRFREESHEQFLGGRKP